MLPSFLITFREVMEAALIVATILGILTKLGQKREIGAVWLATATAFIVSIVLLGIASVLGLKIQEIYSGRVEQTIEGILMMTSAIFITWAVFFLHNYFGRYKTHLLAKLKSTVELEEQKGLFALVFTAVFREGFEIVLFLSSIYFSSNPQDIFAGFFVGTLAALAICGLLFTATLRMPVFYAFRTTSILLILFAAGLLARGAHEFVEAGMLVAAPAISFPFLPEKSTFVGNTIQAIFGVTKKMDITQLTLYFLYTGLMMWRVFFRASPVKVAKRLKD